MSRKTMTMEENGFGGSLNPDDYPHLSPEEIMAQTEAIELAKAEKKRQREHRKRVKELQEVQFRKSQVVAPIILVLTVLLCLGIILWTQTEQMHSK